MSPWWSLMGLLSWWPIFWPSHCNSDIWRWNVRSSNRLQRLDYMTGNPYSSQHDDVIKWKHFPRYWPFVRGIHRSPVNSPHKGQWRGALMFPLICVGINGWINNREAGDLRRYCAHYDVSVMSNGFFKLSNKQNLILCNVPSLLNQTFNDVSLVGYILYKNVWNRNIWCNVLGTNRLRLPITFIYTHLNTFCGVCVSSVTFRLNSSKGHRDEFDSWWRHQMETFPALLAICSRFRVNSPHKGQWRGALMCCLICVWINDWVNNRGDLRRHRAHYDVILIFYLLNWWMGSDVKKT